MKGSLALGCPKHEKSGLHVWIQETESYVSSRAVDEIADGATVGSLVDAETRCRGERGMPA